MKSNLRFAQLVFILIFCFYSCSETTEKTNTPLKKTLSGTSQMKKILKEVHSQIDPIKVSYFSNSKRADLFKAKAAQISRLGDKIELEIRYAYELINANKNEPAITKLTSIKSQLEKMPGNEPVIFEVNRLLALAYMRLGEQNNCIQNPNVASCILPIEEDGVYKMQTSVRAAIPIYESMLLQKPDHKETIWMLNFAYMTLGEFPDKVAAKYRLSEKEFRSDIQIPKFKNIANGLGLNTVGLSGGVCVDDFDNDGFLDIVTSSWGINDPIRFFKNNGDGSFQERTEAIGLKGITGGLNLIHSDYNNDGFKDIFVLRGAWFGGEGKIPNSLLKNNGDGTFSDVTKEAGLLSFRPTQTAVWADFNLDGWLDLFVGNESTRTGSFPCELFINNGDGTFKEQLSEAGLENARGFVKAVAAGDFNNDGYPDLYLSILGQNNLLFENSTMQSKGKVTFENKSAVYGVQRPINSFPTWIWDYNNDGWLDIFVACFGIDGVINNNAADLAADNYRGVNVGAQPHIYTNLGMGKFEEESEKLGLDEAMLAMGSNFGDIDNDGFEDFYLGTGAPSFTAIVPNKMLINKNGKRFMDVTGAGGLGHIQKGHGVGFGDLDNDGDQDIFCVLGGAFEGDVFGDALFLNPYGNEKNWLTLELEGGKSNKSAIGARVKLVGKNKSGEKREFHRVVGTGGSFGANSLQIELGLNDISEIELLEIRWPNQEQSKQVVTDLQINRFYKIMEGQKQAVPVSRLKLDF